MELSREQKRLRFRVEHKQIPMGMYTVRYSIHDAHKGTIFYQELECYFDTVEEAGEVIVPATGHVISITLNLNKMYSRRPVEERMNWITMRNN